MHSRETSAEPGIATDPGPVAGRETPERDALFAGLYDELHRLAHRELARHGGQAALSPTTLLHEAYLDMAGRERMTFPDRARFMGYASRVMRGLIIDHARSRSAQKRGGPALITSLRTTVMQQTGVEDDELIRIGDVLDDLAHSDPPLSELVDLKFFCGFSVTEIAALRGASERTVQRDWEKARAYLRRALSRASGA